MNHRASFIIRIFRAGLAGLLLVTLLLPLGILVPASAANGAAIPGLAERQEGMLRAYQALVNNPNDLESFARLAETAAGYAHENTQQFLDDLSYVIIGVSSSRLSLVYCPLARMANSLAQHLGKENVYPALLGFGGNGFRFNDHSNQVQHFWFSVIAAYHLGSKPANLLARYHEWNAPGLLNLLPLSGHGGGTAGDLALSRQGIQLGRALANGMISPEAVSGWLRRNL